MNKYQVLSGLLLAGLLSLAVGCGASSNAQKGGVIPPLPAEGDLKRLEAPWKPLQNPPIVPAVVFVN
jgi:hypothetical protein